MDNDKFFNYYVEILTSTLHDALGKNLVFQTQVKIANEELDSKNKIIESLSSDLEKYVSFEENVEKTVQEKSAELNTKTQEINFLIKERDDAKSQIAHLEIFRNELVSAKQQLQNKEIEITNIKSEYEKIIEELKQNIQYLQLTPSQKKKFTQQKKELSKDGGSF